MWINYLSMSTKKKCGYCKEYGHYKTTCHEIDSNKECPICYSTLSKVKNSLVTPCGHAFCFKCFMKWNETNETCPYCRKNISKKRVIVEYLEIENVIVQEVIVYPSLKEYLFYLFHRFCNLCKRNKDTIVLVPMIVIFFIINYMKVK